MVIGVIVAVMIMASHDGTEPRPGGVGCMCAGVDDGDMSSTLKALLHCSQQIHLKLYGPRALALSDAARARVADCGAAMNAGRVDQCARSMA
jgi:hypothetical protein